VSRPRPVDAEALRDLPLPPLSTGGDKETRGRVLAIAGGARVPGAALLTGVAALRAGAGKLQLAATRAAALALGLAIPEAAVIAVAETPEGEIAAAAGPALAEAAARADAVVIGPGMLDKAEAGRLALSLLEAAPEAGFVLDAAAMVGLQLTAAAVRAMAGRLVLTPHAGEMAALLGDGKDAVLREPLAAGREAATRSGGVVIMKGATSYIVSPDGRAWAHSGGVVGLATSGSGDVLAGVIAGLLARGAPPLTAAVWGVYAHADAGRRLSASLGPVGLLARELLAEIPRALAAPM